jgi:type II secretion system protein N
MSGVEIREASRSGEKSATWNIDRLQMRLGIWAMIFGRTRVAFNSELYSASASGAFNFTSTKQISDFWIAADDLDLSKLTVLSTKFAGFRLRGIASLAMDFDSGANPAQDASGSLTLAIDGFGTASPPTAKQSKVEAEFDIVKGMAKSKKVKITGGDIEADLNLAVKLEKDVMRSRADGSGWFKLSDAFYTKNAPILDLALPTYKSLRQADGRSYLRVAGTLGSPTATLVSKESLDQKASNNPLRNMRPRR